MTINKMLQNFKNELKEEFYKGIEYKPLYYKTKENIEIFKNPSRYEYKKEDLGARGVLLKNGDLFMINSRKVIHSDILRMLEIYSKEDWYRTNSKTLDTFLCVFIDRDFKKALPAESYSYTSKEAKKGFEKYKKIIKKKNPSLKLEF